MCNLHSVPANSPKDFWDLVDPMVNPMVSAPSGFMRERLPGNIFSFPQESPGAAPWKSLEIWDSSGTWQLCSGAFQWKPVITAAMSPNSQK